MLSMRMDLDVQEVFSPSTHLSGDFLNHRLKVALNALDFLIGHLEIRPHGRGAARAILEFRLDVERLAEEVQHETVDHLTVAALMTHLAMAIGVTLQLSPSIDLLAPGLSIEIAASTGDDFQHGRVPSSASALDLLMPVASIGR